jgi:sulfur carrier protein ThiS adenylyltransferase
MTPFPDSPRLSRDARQRDLVPPERLAECHALVVGVGAIGRQVALQLAAMGIPNLTLVDDDVVAIENLAPQGYWQEDLDLLKITATTAVCHRIHPGIRISRMPQRFKRSSVRELPAEQRLVVFACVDSIQARRLIWESVHPVAAFFVDGRMSAEVIRVLSAPAPITDSYYATTLFEPEQAYAGSCTARSTIYTASIAAGLMLGQFTRWLRGLPVDMDLTLNLLSSELTVANPSVQ